MEDFIKELDDLLKKYDFTIYDAIKLYEKYKQRPKKDDAVL